MNKVKVNKIMTPEEEFINVYNRIESGQFVSFIGVHFDSEQYADLTDLALQKIDYFLKEGNLRKVADWIEFSHQLRSRKRWRYYDPNLRKFKE